MGVLMSTISPNMNLIVPSVGSTIGPEWAFDINDCLALIDQHDHTPGKGTPITAAGLNIDADLPFNNHFATQLAGLTLLPQGSTPTLTTIYASGNDLYFVDGIGNNVRITQSGGVVGTPGSISNLSPPATANYSAISSTFEWKSTASLAANMDFGSAIMRNLSPNSTYALTLSPPSLSSNYTLTLPALPSVQSFMTLGTGGAITAPWTVDDTTIKIVSNQLVAQGPALSPLREHSWELNGNYAGLTFPLLNIDAIFMAPANIIISSVWIYNGAVGASGTTEFDLKLILSGNVSATSILTTTGKISSTAFDNVWTDSGTVISAQTGVVKPVLATTAISAGQGIKFDLIQSMTGAAAQDARIRIFYSLA